MRRIKRQFIVLVIAFVMVVPVYSAQNEVDAMNMTLGELIERSQENWLKASIMEGRMNRGFAIGAENFYPLKIYLSSMNVGISPFEFDQLLDESENKTLKELSAEIKSRVENGIFYHGYVQLGEKYYQLVNANASVNGGKCALKCDLMDYDERMQTIDDENVIGQISTITTYKDGTWISEGKLLIDEGPYKGDYRALLEMFLALKGTACGASCTNLVAFCNPKN